MFKRMFTTHAKQYLNIMMHNPNKQFNYNEFIQFKSDIKYIIDKHINMNNALLGFGFSAMGVGFGILYNKSEQDKQQLNAKIDNHSKELNAKIDNHSKELNAKIDILLSSKSKWFGIF